MDTNMTFRMDSEVKTQMASICEALGMSTSTAFNIFAKAFVLYKGITAEAAEMAANIILKLDAVLVDQGMQKSLETGDGYDDKNTQR